VDGNKNKKAPEDLAKNKNKLTLPLAKAEVSEWI